MGCLWRRTQGSAVLVVSRSGDAGPRRDAIAWLPWRAPAVTGPSSVQYGLVGPVLRTCSGSGRRGDSTCEHYFLVVLVEYRAATFRVKAQGVAFTRITWHGLAGGIVSRTWS
jgi:hypothetical protein